LAPLGDLPPKKRWPIGSIFAVMMVLGCMAGLLLPTLRDARDSTMRMEQGNRFKAILLALHGYIDENNRKLPDHAIYSKDGKPLLSWRVALLPYLGQRALYNEFKLDEPWDSAHNIQLLAKMPDAYAHYFDSTGSKKGLTHYQVFVGEPGVSPRPVFVKGMGHAASIKQIEDGMRNTILIVDAAQAVPWTAPEDIPYGPNLPLPELGLTGDRFTVGMGGGSVHWHYKKHVDEQQLRKGILMDDGFPFAPDNIGN
jgi:hypothetical protein